MLILPIGLIAWLAIWLVRKIPNKILRILCYVVLVFLAAIIASYLEDNGWELCYKAGCIH